MHPLKFIVILLLSIMLIQSRTEGELNSFSIDLIHRDSPSSPLYKHSLTSSDLIRNQVLRSLDRLNRSYSNMQIHAKDMVSMVTPNSNNYLMKIYIGSEKVEIFAVMDTGSILTWIQCAPCHRCYHQDAPLFYPKLSTTYEEIDYERELCQLLKKKKRGFFGVCNYTYSYRDGSYTSGILSKETLHLDSTRDEKNVFSKFVFGCGHENIGRFNSRTQGVVGLGRGPLSLISQLETQIKQKFSYCLLPVEEKGTSRLILGPRANTSREGMVSTPLLPTCSSASYCFILESVSVGNERTTIGQNLREIVVDSGTSLTFLHSTIYNKVEAMVKKAVGNSIIPIPDPTNTFRLCYEKQSVVAGVRLPNMVFHFGGAELRLPPKNTFASYHDMYCMMILPDRLSILGSLSQVNFVVEYDLGNMKISFAPANCTAY